MKFQGLHRSYPVSIVFIFLFTYTALSKLFSFVVFRVTLMQSPLIGSYGRALAYAVPVLELCIACLLSIPGTRRNGLWGAFGLMALFTLYVGYMVMVVRGDLPCSCGGILQQLGWWEHFWLNLGLTVLAWVGLRSARHERMKSNFLLQ